MAGWISALLKTNTSVQKQISDISSGFSGGFKNYGQMGDTGKVKFSGKINYTFLGVLFFGFIFLIRKGKKGKK